MYPKTRKLTLITAIVLLAAVPHGIRAESATTGRVAMGAFIPTGDDADVASTSFALQLTGDVELQGRLGVEAEFNWVPVNLESSVIPSGNLIEARQVSGLVGFRASSERLSATSRRPVAYLSVRAGFSRIAVTSDTTTSVPGWIGNAVDATQNLPPFSFPLRSTENAFVISPRAGFIVRSSGAKLFDFSVSTAFLFDQGEITTQIFATVGFGLLGNLD